MAAFLLNAVSGGESFWIGGTDVDQEGEWTWVTGEEFEYTNWGYRQPDMGYWNSEDYLGMVKTPHGWGEFGEWNDFRLVDGYVCGFLCEWDDTDTTSYYTVIGTNYKRLALTDELQKDGAADTDQDTLTDWEEFDSDSELLSWDETGNPIFPSLWTVANTISGFDISERYLREIEGIQDFVQNVRIAPFLSDPTKEDSDEDGLLDGKMQYYNKVVLDSEWHFRGYEQKAMAPKDPDPLAYTGAPDLWKNHISQMNSGEVAVSYGTEDKGIIEHFQKEQADWLVDKLLILRKSINNHEKEIRAVCLLIKDICEGHTAGGHSELFDVLCDPEAVIYDKIKEEHLILDNSTKTVWVQWYTGEVGK